MSTLQEIKQEIEKLSSEELFKLATWISERVSEVWDQQLEEDMLAGRLDVLGAEAVTEYRTRKLWATEVERRLAQIEDGSVSPIPAAKVFNALRRKYSD